MDVSIVHRLSRTASEKIDAGVFHGNNERNKSEVSENERVSATKIK